MTVQPSTTNRAVPTWLVLAVAIVALVIAATALTVMLTATFVRGTGWGWGMMGGAGPAVLGRPANGDVQPGQAGFVAGTAAAPRVVRVWAGPGKTFSPSTIVVARGETVTFDVTAMGPLVHEFMVGPADAVAGDVPGTPEIDQILMMETRSITFTFSGDGPFAFACHEPGHYEAGMRGTITVVG